MLEKYKIRFLFEADDGSGGGAPQDPPADPPTPPVEPSTEPDNKIVFTPEQQVVIDKIIGGARTKEREKAKAELMVEQVAAKEKADKAAHTQTLEDEKKFQELIDEQKGSIAEMTPALESAKEQLKLFEDATQSILTKRIEDLGEPAKVAVESLPGDLDVLEQLNWLSANEDLFKKKEAPGRGTPPKNGVPSKAYQKKEDESPVVVNF